jgi:IgA peptidase M64/peptidase M64-like protein
VKPDAVPAGPSDFTGRTVRIDCRHGGTRDRERLDVEEIVREGEWTGAAAESIPTERGDYRAVLRDAATGQPIASVGYSSFFDEWRTTSDAGSGRERTFSESIRLPEPCRPATLTVEGRSDAGVFEPIRQFEVLPAAIRDALPAEAEVHPLAVSGSDRARVNLLFVAEGYAAADRGKFLRDAERFAELLFAVEPYAARRADFNVRALFAASAESGITDPRRGHAVRTLLDARFDVFGIDRYMLTFENRKLRQLAAHAPYDVLVVLCNTAKYGGGGVFNQYACLAADSPHSQYLVTHELGHSFAGLADEYYTSLVTYEVDALPPSEPWNANVTLAPGRAGLKWKDILDDGVPVPTPWDQPRYDRIALAIRAEDQAAAADPNAAGRLRALHAELATSLESDTYFGRVGAFEGALYRSRGAYRPEVDCLMFSRAHTRFCRVCAREIERHIQSLSSG